MKYILILSSRGADDSYVGPYDSYDDAACEGKGILASPCGAEKFDVVELRARDE